MIFLKILGVLAALFGLFLIVGNAMYDPAMANKAVQRNLVATDCERMKEVAVTSYEKIAARDWCEQMTARFAR